MVSIVYLLDCCFWNGGGEKEFVHIICYYLIIIEYMRN